MKRARLGSRQFLRAISVCVAFTVVVCSLALPARSTGNGRRTEDSNRNHATNAQGQERRVTPTLPQLGPPAANLPNLDELRSIAERRRQNPSALKAPAPIPSTMRSRRRSASVVPGRSLVRDLSTERGPIRSHHARAKIVANRTSSPEPQAQTINVAAAANGGTVSAQNYTADSTYPGYHWQPSYAIDGQRYYHLIASGNDGTGIWRDEHGLSSWLEVDFNGSKSISEIDVYTSKDYPALLTQADPSATDTFSQGGATAFEAQFWNGAGWTTVPGGSITNNNLVWKRIIFAAITTTKIRIVVNAAADGVARIAEVEAWGVPVSPMNVALSANGATATAQNYTADSTYPGYHWQPSYAIDGTRYCHLIQSGNDGTGIWRDEHGLSSWLQIAFDGTKTISEIDVYTIKDYPALLTQADPSATDTFTQGGAAAFEAQYWSGSAWLPIPNAVVTNNNLVWRKFNFVPVTTNKIRVVVNAAADGVARIAELEAWTVATETVTGSDFAMARLDPHNRTGRGGVDLLSNNFNWSLPLVSLPGRSGLDLGWSFLTTRSCGRSREATSISISIKAQSRRDFVSAFPPSKGRTGTIKPTPTSIYW